MTESARHSVGTRPRIVDEVFGVSNPGRRYFVPLGIAVAIAAHAFLWVWAIRSERSLESWSDEVAARIHAELSKEELVEMAKPPPPPPPPEPEKPTAPEPTKPREARARTVRPAQAARIIARAPDPSAPADLTGDAFVTGTADAYAGGVTMGSGTSNVAVQTPEVDMHAREPDRSNSVSLEDQDWNCAWPHEADAEQIDEQSVMLRVVVRTDGSVESANIVSDPGHGFGQAAAACALHTRFTPAHNRHGDPIRSQSPLLRVRFTR